MVGEKIKQPKKVSYKCQACLLTVGHDTALVFLRTLITVDRKELAGKQLTGVVMSQFIKVKHDSQVIMSQLEKVKRDSLGIMSQLEKVEHDSQVIMFQLGKVKHDSQVIMFQLEKLEHDSSPQLIPPLKMKVVNFINSLQYT